MRTWLAAWPVAVGMLALGCDSGNGGVWVPGDTGGDGAGGDTWSDAGDATLPDGGALPDGVGPDAGADLAPVDGGTLHGVPCPSPNAVFDIANPGINALFSVSLMSLMGQDTAMAIGAFMPSAREDFGGADDEPGAAPLDTCVATGGASAQPECTDSAQCAPEQECRNETEDGQEVPNTGHCTTPRDALDVGPFTATGFHGGPLTFTYNAGQSGGYTASADGTLQASAVAFDQTYLVEGQGDPAQGLGPFRAELYVPAQLELTSPAATTSAMGTSEIAVDTTQDLTIEWTKGTDGGTLDISLSGIGGGITCLAANDGSFTIPAEKLQEVGLGGMSFFNMLTLTRETPGRFCGEGVTVGEANFTTAIMLNVNKVK